MSDREFREIQLSGKQVVFLVMSVVVVAVVIFLLGVAVGRDMRESAGPPLSAAVTDTPVAEAPAPAAAADFDYHDLLTGAAGTQPAPARPEPADPVPAPIPEPVPPPAAAPPAPEATGDWFLQVGAYSGRPAADNVVANLKKLSVPAFVLVPTAGSADQLFRVRVGPYATQAEAETVRTRLVREGFSAEIRR